MTWTNVKLIFQRELRDQLRDRRTLFTIAILPILLYPLLGMTLLQVAQFSREHPISVYLIGTDNLPENSRLIEDGRFAKRFCPPDESKLINIVPPDEIPERIRKQVDEIIASGGAGDDSISEKDREKEIARQLQLLQRELFQEGVDAVLYIPGDFSANLPKTGAESGNTSANENNVVDDSASETESNIESNIHTGEEIVNDSENDLDSDEEVDETETLDALASVQIFVNSANDKSRIASDRLAVVFERYHDSIVKRNLKARSVTKREIQPFEVKKKDLASDVRRRAAVWSRILPFVVLVWALTGAFYPAIDLCAGEKERGTLETLLCSPAKRSEIVCGKLLTIMSFSIATSLLNLASMAITGLFVMNQMSQLAPGGQMTQMGPPPIYSLGWLILFLIPIATLFSALSLAVASFARSSKEGQYYLMPLMMVVLPLLMLPMLPSAELDLGTSLIPITGVMLLLRSLIEGRYSEVVQFILPVLGVTTCCCVLAIRWAINQFNNESVLFRESERFGVGTFVRSLVRDRGNLPTYGQAIMCGLIILVIRFFASLTATLPETFADLSRDQLITLIGLVLAPALIMAVTLTKKPLQSLALQRPALISIPSAILLAICLHPAATGLSTLIQTLYPLSDDMMELNRGITALLTSTNIWFALGLIALAPAICEELAFRGFILRGLLTTRKKWTAIFVSSLFFAAAHAILQQSLSAFVIGTVIGYIAVQSRSIFPCIAYHFVHNAFTVLLIKNMIPDWVQNWPMLGYVFSVTEDGVGYHWPAAIVMSLFAIAILLWFRQLPGRLDGHENSSSATNPTGTKAVVAG